MWKTSKYGKKKIEKAGRKIVSGNLTESEKFECLEVIDNWRATHAFPMNTFTVNLVIWQSHSQKPPLIMRVPRCMLQAILTARIHRGGHGLSEQSRIGRYL